MTKQITVGYDGSGPSSAAVLWAAAEAEARGASLRIVKCYDVPYAGEAAGWLANEAYVALVETNKNELAQMQAVVSQSAPGVEILIEASPEHPSTALIDNVDPHDLVVVGASSHRGAAAVWLGSTSRYIVRHSPCPVVVVRGAATRGRPDRVVVGVDGSRASELALRWAADEADLHGVGLLVVHSWFYPYLAVDTASSTTRDIMNVDAACLLERALESARERSAVDVTSELVEGGPATGLLQVVRDGDLLVLGSRGRGALATNVFGSTVNSVLDQAAVPVVVVRGRKEGR